MFVFPQKPTVLSCILLFWLQYFGIVCFLYGFLPMKTPVGGYAVPDDYDAFFKEDGMGPHSNSNLSKPQRLVGQLVFMVIDALRADFVFELDNINKAGLKFKRTDDALEQDDYKIRFLNQLLTQHNVSDIGTMGFLAQVHAPTVTMPRIKAITTGSIPGFVDVLLNFGSKDLGQDSIIEQWSRAGRNISMFGDDTWLGLFPSHFFRSDGTTSFYVSDYTEVDNNVTRHIKDEMVKRDWDVSILHYLGLDHIGHLSGPKSPLIPTKLMEMSKIIENIASSVFQKPWKENLPPVLLVLGDHGMADAGGHGGASIPETITPVVALFPSQYDDNARRLRTRNLPYLIKQHDLASTLSLLTGVPIPRNNIGKFNSELLSIFLTKEDLQSKEQAFCLYNLEQISSCMKSQFGGWYERTEGFKRYSKIKEEILVKKSTPEFSLSSTKECELAIHEMSGILEENMSSYNIKIMLLGITILLINCFAFASWHLLTFINVGFASIEGIVLLLNIARLLSFGSTSFIEEEHQSVYFFVTSICILIFIKTVPSFESFHKKIKNSKLLKWKNVSSIMCILFLLRIARTINQTGDKWLHLPDVSDYLQKPDNQNYLTMVHGFSILLLLTLRLKKMFRWDQESKSSYFLSISLLIIAHVTVFFQKLPDKMLPQMLTVFGDNAEKRKLHSAQIVYGLSFSYIILRANQAKTFSRCCQILLESILLVFSLLVQPYSALLIPIALTAEELLFTVIKDLDSFQEYGALYYLHGLATYFQMGNSNSLASVDVGAGYTGVPSFNPGIICLLMAVNTFNGPIIWILSLCCRITTTTGDDSKGIQKVNFELEQVLKSLGFYRGCELVSLTIICTLCRFHIMVWTVFAPKVLYEMIFSLIMSLLLSLIFVITKLFVKKEDKNKKQ